MQVTFSLSIAVKFTRNSFSWSEIYFNKRLATNTSPSYKVLCSLTEVIPSLTAYYFMQSPLIIKERNLKYKSYEEYFCFKLCGRSAVLKKQQSFNERIY